MDIQTTLSKTNTVGNLFLRLALAGVILPHGAQLLLGSFNGPGFTNAMSYFVEVEGLPSLVGFMVIFLQFFGSLFILFGFATRFMALGMTGLFFGMIITSHLQYGFFMNWYGTQKGEGYEYHLLVIGMAMSLVLTGAGRLSLDAWITRKFIPDYKIAYRRI